MQEYLRDVHISTKALRISDFLGWLPAAFASPDMISKRLENSIESKEKL